MAYDFSQLELPRPPRLPAPPMALDPVQRAYFDELNRTLSLYFQRVDHVLREVITNVPAVP